RDAVLAHEADDVDRDDAALGEQVSISLADLVAELRPGRDAPVREEVQVTLPSALLVDSNDLRGLGVPAAQRDVAAERGRLRDEQEDDEDRGEARPEPRRDGEAIRHAPDGEEHRPSARPEHPRSAAAAVAASGARIGLAREPAEGVHALSLIELRDPPALRA